MSDAKRCAGKECGALVLWRYTSTGARIPLDVDPVPQASTDTYVIVDGQSCRPSEPMFDPPGTNHHRSHWKTCPNAEQFKR